jgi:hypothetical protein
MVVGYQSPATVDIDAISADRVREEVLERPACVPN